MSHPTHFINQGGDAHYARNVGATLPGGNCVSIYAGKADRCVTLALSTDACYSAMSFTADQARAVAAELLACADALQGWA